MNPELTGQNANERNQREHDAKTGAKKVALFSYDAGTDSSERVGNSNPLPTSSPTQAIRLDDTTTANVTYVGKAAVASSAASAVWQIQKIDETSGMVITWVDGDDNFDNVWNNRASLSYS